jgi:HK97 gp10 family phage protein
MSVTMDLEGFSELENLLDQLSNAAGKGVLRRSLKKAAQPTADLMNSYAPKGPTGNLKGSIIVGTKLSKSQAGKHRKLVRGDKASVEMFVGADHNLSGRHAHLVEFGTGPRFHEKTGRAVGAMPPQPFVRPAWDQDRTAMLARLSQELWGEIEKTIARAQRKAARQAAKG